MRGERILRREAAQAKAARPLTLRWVWRVLSSRASFFTLCIYVVFEYMRPQHLFPVINVIPWGQSLLICCLALFLLEGNLPRVRKYPDWLFLAFSCIVLSSWALVGYSDKARAPLELWVSWMVVYLLISNIVVRRDLFTVLIIVFLLVNLKMAQHAARTFALRGGEFADWGAAGAAGFFRNSGELGIQMTVFFSLSLFFWRAMRSAVPRWASHLIALLPAVSLVAVVATSSRGALLGIAAILAWLSVRGRVSAKRILIVGAVSAIVWVLVPEESKERLAEMGEDDDSIRRLEYWRDGIEIMNAHPITGIGYSNWMRYYETHYFRQISDRHWEKTEAPEGKEYAFISGPQVPHNPFIQAGAELGYPGLIVLVALILACFATNRSTRMLLGPRFGTGDSLYLFSIGLDCALVGFLVSGFFVTVLYYPYFWVNLAMSVGLHRAAKRESRGLRAPRRRGINPHLKPANNGSLLTSLL